ncbi:N-acetyltransferase [Frankia sp. B2]|uniref:GNAT family N-acetyltransferase n=1 Tax=Frankia sp. B2 TaxID=2541730 RepID=UPI00106AD2F4|nr:GNAT family protein [Frankia sp. B2]TFE31005.1 N-acetyltransferase [Frankia sp. B2]
MANSDPSPVVLRAVEESDADLIHRWFQDEHFRSLFGYRYPASRRSWAEWASRHSKPSFEGAAFALCDGDPASPIGLGYLRQASPEDRAAEISLGFGAGDSRGRGAGRRASIELCRFGFEVMGLRRIYAWVMAHNKPAIGTCESLGAVREGAARQARLVQGKAVDLVLFGLLADEFAAMFPSTWPGGSGTGAEAGSRARP